MARKEAQCDGPTIHFAPGRAIPRRSRAPRTPAGPGKKPAPAHPVKHACPVPSGFGVFGFFAGEMVSRVTRQTSDSKYLPPGYLRLSQDDLLPSQDELRLS